MTIGIIGAGLTGLMAASFLKEHGVSDVFLVDKGKSAGGRLATRRIGGGKADHGAQFFTVRTDSLKERTEQWLENGWIKKWFGDPYPRYAGSNGMNSLAKHLAENLDVKTNQKIVKIKENSQGYEIQSETGDRLKADALLLTIPAPQAADLLKASSISAEPELEKIEFNPSFVAMITLKNSLPLGENGHLDSGLPDGMERIADQSAKGISDLPIASIYMTGEWSKEHFEETDKEVLNLILEKAKDYVTQENLEAFQLKRWRYAEAFKPYDRPYLDLKREHPLLIAGDAFLTKDDPAGRTRFESAYLSGIEAGKELLHRAQK